MVPVKACKDCGQTKDADEYPANGTGGKRNICKPCFAARRRRKHHGDDSYHRPLAAMSKAERRVRQREAILKHRYHIGGAEYEAMLAAQGGVCADCGVGPEPGGRRLSVDHDHACCPTSARSCGRCIRGLVCVACNVRRG